VENYRERFVEGVVEELFEVFPVVMVMGPRGAGKTAMIERIVGGDWRCFSFEDSALLLRVRTDPTLFVRGFGSHVAIDEAQKCPDLFHSIKELVDRGFDYKIILSGSANFLLLRSITESLAGRVGLLEMMPFSLAEKMGRGSNEFVKILCRSETVDELYGRLSKLESERLADEDVLEFILNGGFPRIHDLKEQGQRNTWFQNYIGTYIERDLRDLAQVGDVDTFQKVYRLIAYRNSGILNMSSIASDVGVSVQTVKNYISILEASYQVKRLAAYSVEQRKQVIKAPKIFYTDTGLLNYFVQNDSLERMTSGGDWGGVLEAHVFAELYKEIKDMAPRPGLYYWRTNNGAEVDFVLEWKQRLIPVEVKSAATVSPSSLRGLRSFKESQAEGKVLFAVVLYRGDEVVFLNDWTLGVPLGMLY
jgi:predicted AAA+ superfamily ATPase